VDKPVRTNDDTRMPLSATIVVGGLALFGAITLVTWVVAAVAGLAKFVIAVVVLMALVAWVAGRRMDR
jgi:hypothetical protein